MSKKIEDKIKPTIHAYKLTEEELNLRKEHFLKYIMYLKNEDLLDDMEYVTDYYFEYKT